MAPSAEPSVVKTVIALAGVVGVDSLNSKVRSPIVERGLCPSASGGSWPSCVTAPHFPIVKSTM